MERRALSIALYFCAAVLSILFVAQLSGGYFPAIQVQYWPVALAGMFSVASFLLPENGPLGIPQSRFSLRCMGLISFCLSPFLSWAAYLSSYGVGFAPIGRHIYIQVVGMVDLFALMFLLCLYSEALQNSLGVQLRFLGRKMLQAPLWFVLVPAFAVLAGVFLLAFLDGEEELPWRLVPNVLWTILFRDIWGDISAGMFGLAIFLHALGVNCLVCAKRPEPSHSAVMSVSSELPCVLSTIVRGEVPLKPEEELNDKNDPID